MRVTIGIVLAVIAIGGFVGLYAYGRRAEAPPGRRFAEPVREMPPTQSGMAVGADAGAAVPMSSDASPDAAEAPTDRPDTAGRSLDGRMKLDRTSPAGGRASGGARF